MSYAVQGCCNIVYSTYSCGIQISRKMTVLTIRYMQWKNYSFKPPSVLGIHQVFCTFCTQHMFPARQRTAYKNDVVYI